MGKEYTNFEKSLKSSLEGYEVPFNEAHWDELTQKLDGSKIMSVSTLAASIVSAFILVGGALYLTSSDKNANIQEEKTEILVESADSFPSSKVQNSEESETWELKGNNQTSNSVSSDLEGKINRTSDTDVKELKGFDFSTKDAFETSKQNLEPKLPIDSYTETSVSSKSSEKKIEKVLGDEGNVPLNKGEEKANSRLPSKKSVPTMTVSEKTACVGEFINFTATNVDENQNFLWNFGNGDFSTDLAPERKFDEPGVYNVTLILSGTAKEIRSKITIHPKPTAKFSFKESKPGELVFVNQSGSAEKSSWLLNDEHFSKEINPSYNYTQGGTENVTLIVENEYGCSDVKHKDVLLTAPYIINNTPKELSSGRKFKPTLEGISPELLSLQIMNLNSQLIYETISYNPVWDGKLPDGTSPEFGSEFVWLIKVVDKDGNELASDSGQIKIIP